MLLINQKQGSHTTACPVQKWAAFRRRKLFPNVLHQPSISIPLSSHFQLVIHIQSIHHHHQVIIYTKHQLNNLNHALKRLFTNHNNFIAKKIIFSIKTPPRTLYSNIFNKSKFSHLNPILCTQPPLNSDEP